MISTSRNTNLLDNNKEVAEAAGNEQRYESDEGIFLDEEHWAQQKYREAQSWVVQQLLVK